MEPGKEQLQEYIKKFLFEAISSMRTDPKLAETARKYFAAQSRAGLSASTGEQFIKEKEVQGALVKENIRYRAELREQKGNRFPNIAKVLTGGAGSPVGMMGNMQRQASKPFRSVYDYQTSKKELSEFDRTHMGPLTEEDTRKRERLSGEEEGSEQRAKGGFGKNLMGKRMQGMIGKVGKFMDSGKGQGMMAGGMMGASILTMIIKKAMEASPMLQQMLKIMNVAMTLFLRPIGDFIGGMLKPIMLFFLREIAVPMLKKGKNFIKFGEEFGKQLLGFLLKPVETITHAIQAAIHWDEAVREVSARFDGIKAWMTEQKMNVLATEMGYGSRQDLIDDINAPQGNVDRTTRYGEGGAGERLLAVDTELLKEFKALRTDLKTKNYTMADSYSDNLAGKGSPGALMGALATQLEPLVTKTGELTSGFQGLIDLIPGTGTGDVDVYSQATVDGKIGGLDAHVIEERLAAFADNVDITFSDALATINEYQNTATPESRMGEHTGRGGGDYGPMLSKFSQFVMGQMDKYDKGTEEYTKALDAYTQMTTGGLSVTGGNASHGYTLGGGDTGLANQDALTGLMEKFPDWQKQTQIATDVQEQMVDNMKERSEFSGKELVIHESLLREAMGIGDTKGMLNDEEILATKQSVLAAVNMAELNVDGYNAVQALIAQIAATRARMSYGGGGSSGGSGFSMVHGRILPLGSAAINWYRNAGVKVTQMQHGGMINEPIFGIGKSGQQYQFGEAGQEKVTPMFGDKAKGGGSIGPVNINVNIDSVKDDVDLEKIKPIVERALQEVHARRGII